MSERDEYLTEAMGECWHDMVYNEEGDRYSKLYICVKCGHTDNIISEYNDFPSWQGFGKLWEWSQKQNWYYCFLKTVCPYTTDYPSVVHEDFIHPDRFADAVYEYLKERP